MSQPQNDANGPTESESGTNAGRLKQYRRIVLLTDGFSTPFLAKTAISLLRYRTADIAAVLDSTAVGQTAQQLLGAGGDIPVVATVNDLEVDALFIGIAPPGGKLPAAWREIVIAALRRGVDIVSGLHDFLGGDAEFVQLAKSHDCRLIDVRQNDERETAKRHQFRTENLRIHTVGHDCTVGKMVVAIEIQRELKRRDVDAQFIATGQTGIMVSGDGVPIDCVVSDFVNGAAEALVKRHEHHDVLLIEGQGCIAHPSYSAVTLGLLHGCAPDGLIYCYEVGRTHVKGLDDVPLKSARTLIDAYESNANLRHPCRVIGIAMNSRKCSAEQAESERQRMQDEFGLPVCDVYRDGADILADAVAAFRQ